MFCALSQLACATTETWTHQNCSQLDLAPPKSKSLHFRMCSSSMSIVTAMDRASHRFGRVRLDNSSGCTRPGDLLKSLPLLCLKRVSSSYIFFSCNKVFSYWGLSIVTTIAMYSVCRGPQSAVNGKLQDGDDLFPLDTVFRILPKFVENVNKGHL